jgi:dihydropteroate synthase
MVGPSNKSFLTQSTPMATQFATAAAVTAAILAGAHIVRVHEVAEMHAAALFADEIAKSRAE